MNVEITNSRAYIYISTRQGTLQAIVDPDQAEKVKQADRWGLYKDAKGRKFARSGKDSGQQLLHKYLYDLPPGARPLWRNGNTLDCRRSNLTIYTKDGQGIRLDPPESNTQVDMVGVDEVNKLLEDQKPKSKVRGVYFHKAAKKWNAAAYWEGKRYSLGYYDDQAEAEKVVTVFREEGPEGVKKLRGIN